MCLGKRYRVPSSPVFNNDTELEITEVKGVELSIDCQPKGLLEDRWTKKPYTNSKNIIILQLYYGTIF